MKILVFDDIEENRRDVATALRSVAARGDEVLEFDPSPDVPEDGVYENRLHRELTQPRYMDVSLILADRDLSSTPRYGGLSESTVRRAADRLGIPECGYARGERADDGEFIRRGDDRESCVRLSLSDGLETFARRVWAVASGFQQLLKGLCSQSRKKRVPGELLADLLEVPEYATKIGLYASGDRNRLAAISLIKKTQDERENLSGVQCFLGYWLWDSVLRFPGLVVDEVAAASYLNLDLPDFRRAKIQEFIEGARYVGPFSEAKPKLWWRGKLDDLVSSLDGSDRRVALESRIGEKLARSKCSEDPSLPAGYVCFLSGKPVSFANSHPGLPWFPRGADLARVSKSMHEELAPWF